MWLLHNIILFLNIIEKLELNLLFSLTCNTGILFEKLIALIFPFISPHEKRWQFNSSRQNFSIENSSYFFVSTMYEQKLFFWNGRYSKYFCRKHNFLHESQCRKFFWSKSLIFHDIRVKNLHSALEKLIRVFFHSWKKTRNPFFMSRFQCSTWYRKNSSYIFSNFLLIPANKLRSILEFWLEKLNCDFFHFCFTHGKNPK